MRYGVINYIIHLYIRRPAGKLGSQYNKFKILAIYIKGCGERTVIDLFWRTMYQYFAQIAGAITTFTNTMYKNDEGKFFFGVIPVTLRKVLVITVGKARHGAVNGRKTLGKSVQGYDDHKYERTHAFK